MCFLQCDTYLIDFVHPVAGKFKHQFAGLDCSRHGSGVQRAGSSLKYPGYEDSWLFVCTDSASPHKMASLSSSCSLIWAVSAPRERPRAEFQRSAVAQVGAASSLSDTEAGSRCAWSIHTWQTEKEIGAKVRRHIRSV